MAGGRSSNTKRTACFTRSSSGIGHAPVQNKGDNLDLLTVMHNLILLLTRCNNNFFKIHFHEEKIKNLLKTLYFIFNNI